MRHKGFQRVLLPVVWGAMLGMAAPIYAGVSDLMGKLPGDANALIAIDVEAISTSPVAKKEGWFTAPRGSDNPLLIPRGSKQVVVASQLDSSRDVKYSMSLADLSEPLSIDKIALAEGGQKEQIGEKWAVASPGNAYYVVVGDSRLGTIYPADRQAAARMASGYYKGIASPYLMSAVQDAIPLVMAVDTDGMLSQGDVHKRLDARPLKVLEDNSIDLRAFSAMMASMKGVKLQVSFTDEVRGVLTVNFGSDVGVVAGVAKPLVLEMLTRMGMNVVEFSAWNFTAKGNQIRGEGTLTMFTLKRLLSLADTPVPAHLNNETPAVDENAPTDPATVQLKATQAYWKKITGILDSFGKAPSLGEQAAWMRRDARRMGDLPILNVDPDMVAWGITVSDQLAAASRTLSMGQMTVRNTSNSIAIPNAPGFTQNQYDGYYYTNSAQYATDMANYRNQLRAATGAQYEQAAAAAAAQIDNINAMRTEMRVKMTEKYKVEFK